MKEISCGVLVTDGSNLLIQHPSGKPWREGNYDIPKGHKENNESEVACAIRELEEETGLSVKEENLIELGKFSYTDKKDLFLFIHYTEEMPNIHLLQCYSQFEDKKTKMLFDEVDGYRIIDIFSELNYLFPKLQDVIKKVLKLYSENFDNKDEELE